MGLCVFYVEFLGLGFVGTVFWLLTFEFWGGWACVKCLHDMVFGTCVFALAGFCF